MAAATTTIVASTLPESGFDEHGLAGIEQAFFAQVKGGRPHTAALTWRSVDPTVTYAKLIKRAPTRLQWSAGVVPAQEPSPTP